MLFVGVFVAPKKFSLSAIIKYISFVTENFISFTFILCRDMDNKEPYRHENTIYFMKSYC